MPCSCQSQGQWVVTRPNGGTATYADQAAAAADVRRNGGTYVRVT